MNSNGLIFLRPWHTNITPLSDHDFFKAYFVVLRDRFVLHPPRPSRHKPDSGISGKPSKHHVAYNTTNIMPPKHTQANKNTLSYY